MKCSLGNSNFLKDMINDMINKNYICYYRKFRTTTCISSISPSICGYATMCVLHTNTYIHIHTYIHMGFPRLFSCKELASQRRKHTGCGFDLWVRKVLGEGNGNPQPTPVLLPGKSHGQRSLVGYSPWGCKRVRHSLATKPEQHKCINTKQI